ncbi:MAG: sensor domain-containing diguanylate cyclase, partial [Chloroflexota bacterium]|nr:sensor domain-containing diguanylate cyclase [Chloroflexota bacterium]
MKIHQSIGANLELEEISRIAVRELIGIVNCDGCAILLIEGDKVKILAERGFAQTFGGMQLDVDMPAIKYITNTKQAIFTGDLQNSPASSCVPHGCSMNSLICTPIIVNNEVRGVIHLDSLKKNAFAEEDLELTELLAKEISIAAERSFLYSQVRDISVRDGLTSCFNRGKFEVDIIADIASAKLHKEPLSFLMTDIDWFKKYNDFHGHLKGDAVLKRVSATLISNVRPLDGVYRYGGEEFAILLPDTDKEKASHAAKRLQSAVEQKHFKGEDQSQPNGKITISIGVASFPADADSRDHLIEAADSALYRAKHSGRNQVCLFVA